MRALGSMLLSFVMLTACSSSSGSNGTPSSTTDGAIGAPTDDGAIASETTSDGAAPSSAVDPTSICAAFVGAGCSGTPASFASACPGLFITAQSRGCKSAWIQALKDFVATPSAVKCDPIAQTPTVLSNPAITQEAALGEACTGAVNNSACYGVSCSTSLDCGAGLECNSATNRCFKATDPNLLCAGLPCSTALDCPGTCNTALGVCIKK